jgi:CRP/FNR family transcriptional regulator, cyclic AMP receptor protein
MALHDSTSLAKLDLFADVPVETLEDLAGGARRISLAPGQTLIREGEEGDDVLLVTEGAASVSVGGMLIGTIGPGDCVGEMSLLDSAPRSATVMSVGALRALVIPADRFRALLQSEPSVYQRLTATMTARLRNAQSGWAGLAGDPDVLLAALLDLQDSPDPAVAERARRQAASLVEHAAEKRDNLATDGLAPLSPAERRVAGLVAEGLSNQAIADELIVSRHTVDTHVKRCFAKLGLRSRVELATLVLKSS